MPARRTKASASRGRTWCIRAISYLRRARTQARGPPASFPWRAGAPGSVSRGALLTFIKIGHSGSDFWNGFVVQHVEVTRRRCGDHQNRRARDAGASIRSSSWTTTPPSDTVAIVLNRSGYVVATAANGEEALAVLRTGFVPRIDPARPGHAGPRWAWLSRRAARGREAGPDAGHHRLPATDVRARSRRSSRAQAFVPKPIDFENAREQLLMASAPPMSRNTGGFRAVFPCDHATLAWGLEAPPGL